MVLLNLTVEGQTEASFVAQVLAPYLAPRRVHATAYPVYTSKEGDRVHRGGVVDYGRVRADLVARFRQLARTDARFTTMFDLYALPTDFPGFEAARPLPPLERVRVLEKALAEDLARDIDRDRFVPYIQLHEFEALIFADASQLGAVYLEHDRPIARLVEEAKAFPSPEDIDDGRETAPSKRIIRQIPAYEKQKTSVGPLVTRRIGLARLREKCPHFSGWVETLSSLGGMLGPT